MAALLDGPDSARGGRRRRSSSGSGIGSEAAARVLTARDANSRARAGHARSGGAAAPRTRRRLRIGTGLGGGRRKRTGSTDGESGKHAHKVNFSDRNHDAGESDDDDDDDGSTMSDSDDSANAGQRKASVDLGVTPGGQKRGHKDVEAAQHVRHVFGTKEQDGSPAPGTARSSRSGGSASDRRSGMAAATETLVDDDGTAALRAKDGKYGLLPLNSSRIANRARAKASAVPVRSDAPGMLRHQSGLPRHELIDSRPRPKPPPPPPPLGQKVIDAVVSGNHHMVEALLQEAATAHQTPGGEGVAGAGADYDAEEAWLDGALVPGGGGRGKTGGGPPTGYGVTAADSVSSLGAESDGSSVSGPAAAARAIARAEREQRRRNREAAARLAATCAFRDKTDGYTPLARAASAGAVAAARRLLEASLAELTAAVPIVEVRKLPPWAVEGGEEGGDRGGGAESASAGRPKLGPSTGMRQGKTVAVRFAHGAGTASGAAAAAASASAAEPGAAAAQSQTHAPVIVGALLPAHLAVLSGHADVLQLLLESSPRKLLTTRGLTTRMLQVAALRLDDAAFRGSGVLLGWDRAHLEPQPPPLHVAVSRGDAECAALLLTHGAPRDTPYPVGTGTTALHLAANNGDVPCLTALLKARPPPGLDVVDSDGRTPLHLAMAPTGSSPTGDGSTTGTSGVGGRGGGAATREHGSVAELLIRCGASLETPDRLGDTPLLTATRHNNFAGAAMLLSHGAKAAAANARRRTALHVACQEGLLQVASLLAKDYGVDPCVVDSRGRTALHWAAAQGHSEVGQLVLAQAEARDAGVAATLRTGAGAGSGEAGGAAAAIGSGGGSDAVVLQRVPWSREGDAVSWLVSATDADGSTALHLAAFVGDAVLVRSLLASGADVDATDGAGRNAFDIAGERGHRRLWRSLLDHEGASVSAVSKAEMAGVVTYHARPLPDNHVTPGAAHEAAVQRIASAKNARRGEYFAVVAAEGGFGGGIGAHVARDAKREAQAAAADRTGGGDGDGKGDDGAIEGGEGASGGDVATGGGASAVGDFAVGVGGGGAASRVTATPIGLGVPGPSARAGRPTSAGRMRRGAAQTAAVTAVRRTSSSAAAAQAAGASDAEEEEDVYAYASDTDDEGRYFDAKEA